MLNTKYFILGKQGKEIAFPNPSAMGNVWFIQNIKYVNSPDEEITELNSFQPKTDAIVHKEFESKIPKTQYDGSGTIQLESHTPNKLVYKSDGASEQFAVFSEVWYGPDLGWKLSIDGKETDLIRVNYVLRGSHIPAGQHQIVMEFKPQSFYLGKTLSMICSLLIILFLGFVGYKELFKLKI